MSQKQKLVVIGNGMAGARTVEEILARGGGDQFEITMFGDEPTGNYNRILLSNVLNGSYQEDEIYLNPLSWYEENGIRLHSGMRAAGLLRRAKLVYGEDGSAEPYDRLIIATGSRAFIPHMEGITMPDGSFKPGVFVFRTLDDCREIARYAEGKKTAAVIGGGLLGLEAARGLQNFGVEVNVVHLGRPPDAAAVGSRAPARFSRTAWSGWASKSCSRKTPRRSSASTSVTRTALRRRHDARVRHGGDLGRDQGQLGNRRRIGSLGRTRHRRRRSDALGG